MPRSRKQRRQVVGICEQLCPLLDMPPEMLELIAFRLPVGDRVALQRTCRTFNRLLHGMPNAFLPTDFRVLDTTELWTVRALLRVWANHPISGATRGLMFDVNQDQSHIDTIKYISTTLGPVMATVGSVSWVTDHDSRFVHDTRHLYNNIKFFLKNTAASSLTTLEIDVRGMGSYTVGGILERCIHLVDFAYTTVHDDGSAIFGVLAELPSLTALRMQYADKVPISNLVSVLRENRLRHLELFGHFGWRTTIFQMIAAHCTHLVSVSIEDETLPLPETSIVRNILKGNPQLEQVVVTSGTSVDWTNDYAVIGQDFPTVNVQMSYKDISLVFPSRPFRYNSGFYRKCTDHFRSKLTRRSETEWHQRYRDKTSNAGVVIAQMQTTSSTKIPVGGVPGHVIPIEYYNAYSPVLCASPRMYVPSARSLFDPTLVPLLTHYPPAGLVPRVTQLELVLRVTRPIGWPYDYPAK